MGELWNLILLNPMLNVLIVLSRVFFDNFGIAIIILTIIVRIITLPLTLQQLRMTKVMSQLQPRMAELQKKYAKDKEKLSQETMKLYRETGVNPLGCVLPMLIQFPIWIALYQSVMQALAATPEALLGLSEHLYPWGMVHQAVPLESRWLWLDLSAPDPFFIMPVLVAGSMWLTQKMMSMPSPDPKSQQMTRMMNTMMPLMFGFFALSFPSGLSLYWVANSIIGMVIQYPVTGWGSLPFPAIQWSKLLSFRAQKPATVEPTPVIAEKERNADGKPGDKRQDGRGSYRTRPGTTGGKPRSRKYRDLK